MTSSSSAAIVPCRRFLSIMLLLSLVLVAADAWAPFSSSSPPSSPRSRIVISRGVGAGGCCFVVPPPSSLPRRQEGSGHNGVPLPRRPVVAIAPPSITTTTAAAGGDATAVSTRRRALTQCWALPGGSGRQQQHEEEEEDADLREVRRLEAILDKRLQLAGEAMREDAPAYAALLALQSLPVLCHGASGANFLYFWCTATLAVYLGGKRAAAVAKAGKIFQALDVRNAVVAPFAASVSLFGTYYILKNWQLDIATIYQVMTTSFGWFCLRDVLASLLLAIKPNTVTVPTSKAAGAVAGAAICALYLWASPAFLPGLLPPPLPSSEWILPLAANVITAGIALQAQGTLNLKSVRPALLFLAGLFFYDIYFVFLAPGGVMESVATSVEGPVKFLSPRAASGLTPGAYPFSILGLGDVVIPGLFIGLLKKFEDAQAEGERGEGAGLSLFNAGVAGYGAGLLLTFLANSLSHRGQPALLYINPAMTITALLAAWQGGQWDKLWAFSSQEDDDDDDEQQRQQRTASPSK